MSEDDLADTLDALERDLLDAAELSDRQGARLLARNFEIWAHTVASARADICEGVAYPGTLMEYLNGEGDYALPADREGPAHE